MTTIFLDINDEIYTIKCLTYNITTQSYKIDKEKVATWEEVTFSCPSESTKFAFILLKAYLRILLQQRLLACTVRFEFTE